MSLRLNRILRNFLGAVLTASVFAQTGPQPDLRPDTRQAPDTPWQVHVAYGNPSTTSLTVTWQTQRPSEQGVEFGLTHALSQTERAVPVPFKTATGSTWMVTLRDLPPGKDIHYRVGSAAGWSPTRVTRTAPATPQTFTFTAFGDHGTVWPAPENLRAIQDDHPAFHVLMGDISYANGYQPLWDEWFDMMEPFAATTPVMPAIGNHEYETNLGPVTFMGRFSLPETEDQYTFDYGQVRFVVVNTVLGITDPQLRWLEQSLAKARKDGVGWLVVCQHFPLYGTTAGRGFNMPLVAREAALLDQYHVDLVLCGHDHVYERSYPIVGGKPTTQERARYRKGMGAVHVIAGGGGALLYKFAPRPSALNALRELTYSRLVITVTAGGSIAVRAIRLDGSTLDDFEIAP